MALGFGFRCGFLGMLHMEIIQERLEREFDMTVITTVPSVQFKALMTDDTIQLINAPSDMPDPTRMKHIEEPYVKASIEASKQEICRVFSGALPEQRSGQRLSRR